MFCVVPSHYIRSWFSKEKHQNNLYYLKIYPEQKGLRFVVNGATQIYDDFVDDSFMNLREISTDVYDIPSSERNEYYQLLLRSCIH